MSRTKQKQMRSDANPCAARSPRDSYREGMEKAGKERTGSRDSRLSASFCLPSLPRATRLDVQAARLADSQTSIPARRAAAPCTVASGPSLPQPYPIDANRLHSNAILLRNTIEHLRSERRSWPKSQWSVRQTLPHTCNCLLYTTTPLCCEDLEM